jgi:hypothetical protein
MATNDKSPRTGLTRREFLDTATAAVTAAVAALPSGVLPCGLERLVGFRLGRDRRHGSPSYRPTILGAEAWTPPDHPSQLVEIHQRHLSCG